MFQVLAPVAIYPSAEARPALGAQLVPAGKAAWREIARSGKGLEFAHLQICFADVTLAISSRLRADGFIIIEIGLGDVAYYRTRPSEPEASDTALRLQREAVHQTLDESTLGGLMLAAEFIEREGESDPETYPAFDEAVQFGVGHSSDDGPIDVAFLIASTAAIGTGQPFQQPHVPGGHKLFWIHVGAPLVPTQVEIALPEGAPGSLCLHAEFRPRQGNTLIYLCNAGPKPLEAVTVMLTMIDMAAFFEAKGDDRWVDTDPAKQSSLDLVPANCCMLINQLDHMVWDNVTRYQLAYADASGQRWQTETHDCNLCVCDMPESERAWIEFARPTLANMTSLSAQERS